jgi:hypothetical protein
MMTKIVMVTGQALPHIGGVEIHIDRVCKELVKDPSLDVTVLCAAPGGDDYPYKVNRNYAACWNNKYLSQFDIVHFHDFIHFIPVQAASYITFHGWEGHCPPDPGIVAQRQSICKQVAGVVHIGDYLRKWYGTSHHAKDVTILGGCYPKPYRQDIRTNKIGYVGQLRKDKGVNVYEEAASLMPWCRFDVASNIAPELIDKFWEDKRIGFCNGYLASLEAMINSVPCIAYCDNEMVVDGLKEMPLFISASATEIVEGVEIIDATYDNVSKLVHEFAMNNTWEIAANKYKKLWGLI